MRKLVGRVGRVGPVGLVGIVLAVGGCHTDMWRQPKAMPQQPFDTNVFADGRADRPKVGGTIAWGKNHTGDPKYSAYKDGKLVTSLPPTLKIDGETFSTTDTEDLKKILGRGHGRYEIFCVPCHGGIGDGKGMITQRGLSVRRKPANYHTDRLRKMPIGHFFDVITNGAGVMFSYGARIDVDDRWAIAAYIRVLQRSQNAAEKDLSVSEVEETKKPPAARAGENYE